MRELVESLIMINGKDLAPQRDSEQEIWNRLVRVFVRQVNVRPEKVVPSASITRDLGIYLEVPFSQKALALSIVVFLRAFGVLKAIDNFDFPDDVIVKLGQLFGWDPVFLMHCGCAYRLYFVLV